MGSENANEGRMLCDGRLPINRIPFINQVVGCKCLIQQVLGSSFSKKKKKLRLKRALLHLFIYLFIYLFYKLVSCFFFYLFFLNDKIKIKHFKKTNTKCWMIFLRHISKIFSTSNISKIIYLKKINFKNG